MTTTKPQSTTEPIEAPERVKLWICCHCQTPRMVGLTVCERCHKRLHDVVEYARISPASAAPVVDEYDDLDTVARRAAKRAFAIMQRYCACASSVGIEPLPLSLDDLAEIQKRRASMLFPGGKSTGPWLDIDRLLAHVEALQLAVKVRTNAINLQLETIKELRAGAAATAAPQSECPVCLGKHHGYDEDGYAESCPNGVVLNAAAPVEQSEEKIETHLGATREK